VAMRFDEAVGMWIEKKSRSWTSTTTGFVRHLADNWKRIFGEKEVAEIRVMDVERLELERDNGQRSGSALNQERTYLRSFFKWAKANSIGPGQEPTQTWALKKATVKRKYAEVSVEDEDRLIEAASPRIKRFIRLAVRTGLREGTIRRLTWEMVGPTWVLQIPASIMKAKEEHRMPLMPEVIRELGPRGAGLLLPELPPAHKVWKLFKEATKKAAMDPATSPHDLRRSWVSRLSRANVPAQVVQKLGGWKTMGVLLAHYCMPIPDDQARSIFEKANQRTDVVQVSV
jgi:integrase